MKTDLKKELKELYLPSAKEVVLVDVPRMNFLMIDGEGDPNKSPVFQPIINALYGVSYTLKFTIKKEDPAQDFRVMPLEGLWWMDDMTLPFLKNKALWKWTLMIAQPKAVTKTRVSKAVEELKRKKDLPALDRLRFEPFHEGRAVQILHIGPYCDEGPTIEKMHQFIKEHGLRSRGKHHEIYMSDPRRAAPEKLKTVLRQPVQ